MSSSFVVSLLGKNECLATHCSLRLMEEAHEDSFYRYNKECERDKATEETQEKSECQGIRSPDGRCFLAAWGVSTTFRNVDRYRTCQPGKVTPHPDVQPGPTTWQTLFSGWGDMPLSGYTVNKLRRAAVLQLNIEGLNTSKTNVLHHLAVQYDALVVF